MTSEQAKRLSDDAITRHIEALDRGQSDALKAYLAVMSRFHQYSWGNSLLIYSQKRDATHVAGFHAWLKLDRHVRKGEKGIVILAPMVGRKRRAEREVEEDSESRVFGFRAAYVFDRLSRDFRDSSSIDVELGKLVLSWRLTEGGRSPTEVSRQTMRRRQLGRDQETDGERNLPRAEAGQRRVLPHPRPTWVSRSRGQRVP